MMFRWILISVSLSAAGALAECPPPPDHGAKILELAEQARTAQSEQQGRQISNAMWELWIDAPDEIAQEVLDSGMRQRESYDFAGAIVTFDRLVAYCPDYAEGYNQRAFALFLQQNFARALVDLEKALALSPNHVAARAGLALTLMQLQRPAQARAELRAALALNPWLQERHLLAKGGPLAAPGDDI